jgi:hypothetical protein
VTVSNLPAADLPVKVSLSEAEQRKLDHARERETYTYYNDGDPEGRVCTCHEAVASTLRRRGARLVQVSGGGRAGPKCWIFEAPKSWFKTPGPPAKRTQKQREAARRTVKRLRLARLNGSLPSRATELVAVEG